MPGTCKILIAEELENVNKKLQLEIEEHARAEEELKKHCEHLEELVKERTAEVDRLKSVFLFLSSMSHELKTPLNSIIGFTGIMLMGMAGEITEEQRQQLTIVKSSARHLLELISDLLDVSKIEAGKVELSLADFGLDEVIREVVEIISPAINEKGLKLIREVPEGITVFSDKRRIKQVLINLINNAVKFTDEGNVNISAKILKDKMLEIRITDTGIGIKPEDMNKLFQPFQQIETSSAGTDKETGLGLYLCKKLVTLLGGDISAKSNYGSGSEFTFIIPVTIGEE